MRLAEKRITKTSPPFHEADTEGYICTCITDCPYGDMHSNCTTLDLSQCSDPANSGCCERCAAKGGNVLMH